MKEPFGKEGKIEFKGDYYNCWKRTEIHKNLSGPDQQLSMIGGELLYRLKFQIDPLNKTFHVSE